MLIWFIFILLTITDAKRKSYDSPIPSNYKAFNHHGSDGSEIRQQGADFGHVYREGFQRNYNQQQFDRENDMVQPDFSILKELNQNNNRNTQPNLKKQPLVFLSPRDELLHHKKYSKSFIEPQRDDAKETGHSNQDLKSNTRPPWYDFSKLLERNLAHPFASKSRKVFETRDDRKFKNIDNKEFKKVKMQSVNFSNYFEDSTFLKKSYRNKLDWTTCDDFVKRSVFHPDDVVNTKWLPFYVWSTRDFDSAVIHTFSYPTKKIVQYFKTTFSPYMQKLNWNEPKLLLRERREILLIAGDRRGLFYGLPKQELPSHIKGENVTLPTITLRMKIHDPYLAMMYCDEKYAVIMAELGTEPHSKEDKILEASTLKFNGTGKPVQRDLKTEMVLEELEKKKKIEAESRKVIPIDFPRVDLQARVRFF